MVFSFRWMGQSKVVFTKCICSLFFVTGCEKHLYKGRYLQRISWKAKEKSDGKENNFDISLRVLIKERTWHVSWGFYTAILTFLPLLCYKRYCLISVGSFADAWHDFFRAAAMYSIKRDYSLSDTVLYRWRLGKSHFGPSVTWSN